MSHRDDPHTSHDAAGRAAKGTKKEMLYGAIRVALELGPGTPAEVLARYQANRKGAGEWLPASVDLQDIRRRMTEMQRDFGTIEPIKVGTYRGGKPQYATREGQRVMRLVEAVAA
ncbi:hypothetical protein [Agromyces sp. NPDC058064]|uniref:hypothetical protein n=1 Tax=Agromyces sp. NPDC058064 TaxID=3346322 RepID=UPI0036D82F45